MNGETHDHPGGAMRLQVMKAAGVGIALVALLGACGSSSKKSVATTPPTTLAPATTTTPTTANPNAPTINATPTSGLKNNQVVTVTGDHWTPGMQIAITECVDKGNATGASDCNLAGIGPSTKKVGADGKYGPVKYTILSKPSGTDAACNNTTNKCVISLGPLTNGAHATADLLFG
jgi:hypothetical protein